MLKKSAVFITIMAIFGAPAFAFADVGQSEKARERAQVILDRVDEISYGNISSIKSDVEDSARLRAMREAAFTIGSQEGYVYYVNRFVAKVEENERYLRNFDFSALMTAASDNAREAYVLPPVIEKVVNAEAVNSEGTQLKLSGEVYRILSNVRLVTAPPTWRDYLIPEGFSNTNPPPEDLLPKTRSEEKLWAMWVRKGFSSGMEQGDIEMRHRVAQLRTDFVGMVRYLNLAERNMVKKPYVALQNIPVEGDGGEMKLRSSIYEITEGASLNTNRGSWQTNAHSNDRGSLRKDAP